MLYQLFSSFLRGASCPKSPRAPPLPATLFMRLTARYVKPEKFYESYGQELTVAKQGENAQRGLTKKKAAVEAGRQILWYGFRRGAANALQRRSLSR
jgi:hypothetical protein